MKNTNNNTQRDSRSSTKSSNNAAKMARLERKVKDLESKRPTPFSLRERGTRIIYALLFTHDGVKYHNTDACTLNLHKFFSLNMLFRNVITITKGVTANPDSISVRKPKKVIDNNGRETTENFRYDQSRKDAVKANHRDRMELLLFVASQNDEVSDALDLIGNKLELIDQHLKSNDLYDEYVNKNFTSDEKGELAAKVLNEI